MEDLWGEGRGLALNLCRWMIAWIAVGVLFLDSMQFI